MNCGLLQDRIDIERDEQESRIVSISEYFEVATRVSSTYISEISSGIFLKMSSSRLLSIASGVVSSSNLL